MDWDKLRIFYVVADSGSFTHAGERLNLSQSAVSRQIRALEDSLDLPLFHRHARGLILTEQGETLYETARDVFTKLSTTESRLRESKDKPEGPLRVTTAIGFGSIWLTSRLGEFVERYKDISVSLLVADVELDLAMREADVAIRVGRPRQPDLIQRHLFTSHFGVYAAPAYLNRFGTPTSVAELSEHRVVTYGEALPLPFEGLNWLAHAIKEAEPTFESVLNINNVYGIFRAVQAGIGIATLPAFLAEEDPQLVRILPEVESPTAEVYFAYAEELRNSRRVMVFRDFLLRKVSETRF
jgi:DNA-binding transcriptional LysR family regulator